MKVLNREIEVIAYFPLGKESPRPLKMRHTDCLGNQVVIRIDKIVDYWEEKKAGNRIYIYRCETVHSEKYTVIPFELRYYRELNNWVLYKV